MFTPHPNNPEVRRNSGWAGLSFLAWLTASSLLTLETHGQSQSSLILSEFLGSNRTGLVDDHGDASDWIEIWNATAQPLTTEHHYLTDDIDVPDKWALPAFVIPSGGYRIIFASGKNQNHSPDALHTNFRLSRDEGSFLALTQKTEAGVQVLTAYPSYPRQYPDRSYGWSDTGPTYFQQPSPGGPNTGETRQGRVADTRFSHHRGFYHHPVEIHLSSKTPGATLAFTLDGSQPSLRNGTRVPAQTKHEPPSHRLQISTPTTLRVMAFREGFESTNVDTQTYLFPNKVLHQDETFHAIGHSNRWGHRGPDWEMDREITQHQDPEIRPEPSDLLRIATVSLSFDFKEVFGPRGIYIAGQGVERETSIEYLEPRLNDELKVESMRSFQTDGTLQIVGGSSPNRWKSDKLSLRLKFHEDLRFPVFGGRAVNRFDTLVLDARLNNVWHYGGGVEPKGQRDRAQYVRDQYTANLHNQLGGRSPHGRHVHLYLNGIYWGIHTLHERPDDNFAASYLGGDNEDYDSIKHRPNDILQGTGRAYQRLHTLADQVAASGEAYVALTQLLDVPDFIHYMLVNYYVGNTDWAHHNWYASHHRTTASGRWRFHSWDAEKGLHHVNDDRTGRNDSGGPTNLHHDLVQNTEYRLQFADRAYAALRWGPLSPTAARHSYRHISDLISLPLRAESARWGDNHRARPYTRLDWLETRHQLFGTSTQVSSPLFDYFERRSKIVLDQFRRRGWLGALEPPTFNRHGGFVDAGFQATLSAEPGELVYYTTDGSDPRIPGETGPQERTSLIPENALKRAIMPKDGRLGLDWIQPDFDDSTWPRGRRGAGYENGKGYQSFIDPSLDFRSDVRSDNHESIYLRAEFSLPASHAFDQLTLFLRYDDGFVAYLNGSEVARRNAPGQAHRPVTWNRGASTTHSDGEATRLLPVDITSHRDRLQSGKNVIAIHGLNSGPSSSDFLIWPTLEGSQSQGGRPDTTQPSAIRYQDPISIKQPTLIRARSVKGGSWSPLTTAAFLPNTTLPDRTNLKLTQIHYRPAPPQPDEIAAGFVRRSDFEFLELTNLSNRFLHLDGCYFETGIRFRFSNPIPPLAPLGSLIVAANPSAFSHRFGGDQKVLGPFQFRSKLDNSGEGISLSNPEGRQLLSVRFDDNAPWPKAADGQGASLVLKDPRGRVDPDQPEAWRAPPIDPPPHPATPGGNPVNSWLVLHFDPADRARPEISGWDADPDLDGLSNLREYFHATDPQNPNPASPGLRIMNRNSLSQPIVLTYQRGALVSDELGVLESSENLIDWAPLAGESFDTRIESEGSLDTVTVEWFPQSQQQFFRLRVRQPHP